MGCYTLHVVLVVLLVGAGLANAGPSVARSAAVPKSKTAVPVPKAEPVAVPEPEPVAVPEPAAEPEPVAAVPVAEPEPAASVPEPVAEPEPVAAVPEPVAESEPAAAVPEPVAEPAAAVPEPAAEPEPAASEVPKTAAVEAAPSPVVVAESEVAVDDVPDVRQRLLDPCENGQGVCTSPLECSFQRGENIGNCDSGSVCCHISKTCEKGKEVEITTNNTYFVEPPKSWEPNGPIHCGVIVKKIQTLFSQPICQMRLDFVNFNSVGPDPRSGDCNYDMLTIEHGDASSRVHKVCGLNDGQHMYIDVKHTDFIRLRMNVDYSKEPNRVRKWNIRITQLPCRSPRLAPPGCLQYYEDYSGIIKSFNYGPSGVNETSYPLGLRYSMCFKRGPDACRIYLKKAGEFGLGEVPTETNTRTNAWNEIDEECYNKRTATRTSISKAYVAVDNVKFCGNTFPDEYRSEDNGINVISFVSPTHEAVRDDDPPRQPPGFRFFYRLLSCGTS